jgi:hypothetical protein
MKPVAEVRAGVLCSLRRNLPDGTVLVTQADAEAAIKHAVRVALLYASQRLGASDIPREEDVVAVLARLKEEQA